MDDARLHTYTGTRLYTYTGTYIPSICIHAIYLYQWEASPSTPSPKRQKKKGRKKNLNFQRCLGMVRDNVQRSVAKQQRITHQG